MRVLECLKLKLTHTCACPLYRLAAIPPPAKGSSRASKDDRMLSRTCTLVIGLSVVCFGLAKPVGLKDIEGFAKGPANSRTFKNSAVPDYALRILNATQYPKALCLDGTQGAYYHRPALSGLAANKWRIFFQGGGWCVSDEDCFGRSQTPLGSNLNLTATAVDPAGYCGSSFLSGDPADAPGFWDWHAVYVPYCDGGSMTGKNETLTVVNVSVLVPSWHSLSIGVPSTGCRDPLQRRLYPRRFYRRPHLCCRCRCSH